MASLLRTPSILGRVAAAAALALGALATAAATPADAAAARTAVSTSYPNPRVGALFASMGSSVHGCTASVVSSTSYDLIVTAAHCVHGSGYGMKFVPGYNAGAAPYGSWMVTQAYVMPGWVSVRNTEEDIAVLRVAKRYSGGSYRGVQQVVGGNPIAYSGPASGAGVTIPAYNAGSGDRQITCTNSVYWTWSGGKRYSTFPCGNYQDGVSGAPYLLGGYIRGVIGGLHQGGCYPSISYSSDIASDGYEGIQLVRRAQSHQTPNYNIPWAGSDGC